MSNKTSKEDFEYFKKYVKIYQKEFGLTNFKLYFNHDNKHMDAYAYIYSEVENGIATIGLTQNWDSLKITKEQLRYSAKHEILHLLLADLVQVGKYRQSVDTDFIRAQHAVIRRLENAWN